MLFFFVLVCFGALLAFAPFSSLLCSFVSLHFLGFFRLLHSSHFSSVSVVWVRRSSLVVVPRFINRPLPPKHCKANYSNRPPKTASRRPGRRTFPRSGLAAISVVELWTRRAPCRALQQNRSSQTRWSDQRREGSARRSGSAYWKRGAPISAASSHCQLQRQLFPMRYHLALERS